MSLTMHRASIPVFIRAFKILDTLLDKGAAHAAETGTDLVNARLAPDMLILSAQVQRASDTAKMSAERLGGAKPPAMPDTETSFPELKARVAATIAYLETVTPDMLADAETREVVLRLGPDRSITFDGLAYLFDFALPNFYFHIATAYDILRHNGVPLGKRDFLGGV